MSRRPTGAHPRRGSGRAREAGAPGDASAAQEAGGPVPHDENGLTPREWPFFLWPSHSSV